MIWNFLIVFLFGFLSATLWHYYLYGKKLGTSLGEFLHSSLDGILGLVALAILCVPLITAYLLIVGFLLHRF